MKSVRELIADGCHSCGATLLEMVDIYPAAISFCLAADRAMWSKPRVVTLCRSCASECDRQATNPEEGGNYFAE